MRQPRGKNWEIEIAPRAWVVLGTVAGDVFRKIQQELEILARHFSALGSGSFDSEGRQLFQVGDYEASCRLDADRKILYLERVIQRRLSREDESTELTETGRRKRKPV